MDWLTPRLDANRFGNQLRHNQRTVERGRERARRGGANATPSTAPAARPTTLADRQAVWSENQAEYRQRLLRDGQAGADRWLDDRARARRR